MQIIRAEAFPQNFPTKLQALRN